MKKRQARKSEHISWAVALPGGPVHSGFQDVYLVHNCLPGLAMKEIDLSTVFCGRPLKSPFLINAITGGSPQVAGINRSLARVARRTGVAMAVGSQRAAIEDPGVTDSFTVVREENPDGFIMANVSAGASLEEARAAVKMLAADALQVHLNAAQEVVMVEGERDFRGWLENIGTMAAGVGVPVVAKEVGFGVAAEEAHKLADAGVAAIDVGGKGGTNFVAIEARRSAPYWVESFLDWGIPTAPALVELAHHVSHRVELVAGGGLRTGVDMVKALALGATLVSAAAPLVKALVKEDEEALLRLVENLKEEMAAAMLLTGSRNVGELRNRPAVITGRTAEWLRARGIDAFPGFQK